MPNISYEGISKCCFTGYRPAKFPFSLCKDDVEYRKFENSLVDEILKLIASGCNIFYSGMAMGFDIIAAEIIVMLKSSYKSADIKLVCVLPFEEQGESLTGYWKNRFDNVLKQCDEKVIISKTYFSGCYQKRNVYMVENSDCVLTWYDGKQGGTRNTLNYALNKKRYVINICENCNDSFAVQTWFDVI